MLVFCVFLLNAVDYCECYMDSGVNPELVFEQYGEIRNVVHEEHYRLMQEESHL